MTPHEEDRYHRRVAMFVARGMPACEAGDFAERCFTRDRERDKRRSCIECAHCRNGYCKAQDRMAIDGIVLHHCAQFEWAVPA